MTYIEILTEKNLEKCIEQGEFQMYLQPQYSIGESTIIGAEALTRWKHQDTYVSPAEFIPILEEKGLVSLLDQYIWECAFQLQADKQKDGLELIPISINVSRKDFCDVDVYGILTGLSRKYEVSPAYIHIEITESAFVDDKETIFSSVKSLKQFGFKILIDDFGSGYSALNILKDIEADIVKLDMKFFDLNAENSLRARDIISSVISMTQLLGMGIIAEGVENAEQLDILKEFGCDVIQGYFFYRPMKVSDFDSLMHRLVDASPRKKMDDRLFGKECLEESINLLEKGEYENALSLAKRAWEQVSCEIDVELYCNIENIIGIIYSAMGNELMAIEHYLTGLSVSKKNDYSIASGKFYNNIGSEYQNLNDHEHAIEYFQLSLNELERADNIGQENYEYRAFITNMNLCSEYYELGEYEKAESFLDRARTFLNHPSNESNRLGFLIEQCRLYLQTGREKSVRDKFPKLMELALNTKDRSDFWSDMEALCNFALSLSEFDAMKEIIDVMEQQVNLFSDDRLGLDIKVKIQEKLLAYYNGVGDVARIRETELEYIRLCRMQYQEVKKARAAAIDYKIQLNTQYEENILYKKQIDIDQLTGVGNRYKLEKDYKMIKEICGENGCQIGVGIIDLDGFKQINDTYGHLQGDRYLQVISRIIRKTVISTGGVYRYGGDEFVVLLVDVDADMIQQIAEKIEQAIEKQKLKNENSEEKMLSASQGYYILNSVKNSDIWQVLPFADQQLYMVKNSGKKSYRIMQEAV
ncbi:MAG: EAL domain-containing protein [Roseburia sp.]